MSAASLISSLSSIKSTTISATDARAWGFRTLSSIDNPKASKATKYGYLNAILYMAPADSADGTFNLCPFAGACRDLCLGEYSGQAAIGKPERNATIRARKARALAYMHHRQEFMVYVAADIRRLRDIARRHSLRLVYRYNGSTDVGVPLALLLEFPDVIFIDYTKSPHKMRAYLNGKFPKNYHVTFSRDSHNEELAQEFLGRGGNVAIVLHGDSAQQKSRLLAQGWRGHTAIDGDAHDIRTPDMDGHGKVVVLTPKGNKAKTSDSPFLVRVAA